MVTVFVGRNILHPLSPFYALSLASNDLIKDILYPSIFKILSIAMFQ